MILVVDVKNMAYRGAWAVKALRTPQGRDVTAFFGFLKIFGSCLRNFTSVDGVVFCTDAPGSSGSWRFKEFPEYKAKRHEKGGRQEGLRAVVNDNLELIRQFAGAINCYWFEDPDYEADDLIAWTSRHFEPGSYKMIVSADRDMLQLVSPEASVAFPTKRTYSIVTDSNFDTAILDVIKTETKTKGFEPEHPLPQDWWLPLKVMVGDKSDNIPGIPRVAAKRAYDIIMEVRDRVTTPDAWAIVEEWIRVQYARSAGAGKLATNLWNDQERIKQILAQGTRLMKLDPDAPILCRQGFQGRFDHGRLEALLREMNFRSLLPDGANGPDFWSSLKQLSK